MKRYTYKGYELLNGGGGCRIYKDGEFVAAYPRLSDCKLMIDGAVSKDQDLKSFLDYLEKKNRERIEAYRAAGRRYSQIVKEIREGDINAKIDQYKIAAYKYFNTREGALDWSRRRNDLICAGFDRDNLDHIDREIRQQVEIDQELEAWEQQREEAV